MVADQPLVIYPKTNKSGDKKHTIEEMDALYDKWEEQKKKEGSLVGKAFSLDDYLNNRI